jgi:hypothetical protein
MMQSMRLWACTMALARGSANPTRLNPRATAAEMTFWRMSANSLCAVARV